MISFISKISNLEESLSFDDISLIPSRPAGEWPINLGISLGNIKLPIPVFSAAMDTVTGYEMARTMIANGACGPLHKNLPMGENLENIRRLRDEFGADKPIAVAVGVSTTYADLESLVRAGANVIFVDSAHAHSENVGNMVRHIARTYPEIFLVAGNVVTMDGAKYLIDRGAKAIKVGIGSGSICTTRKVTGIGRGQLHSIAEISDYCLRHNVLVIADGGMRDHTDILKAFSAGANAVMLGYLFSGCVESPGETREMGGIQYKYYRGMGSMAAMRKGSADRYNRRLLNGKCVEEGIESYVKVVGPASEVIAGIKEYLFSSLSNLGLRGLSELRDGVSFARVTPTL